MSKILYVLYRNRSTEKILLDKVCTICDNLNPNNILALPSKVGGDDGVFWGLSNPSETTLINSNSVFYGQSFGNPGDWCSIGGEKPDGNYAIFRAGKNKFEIVNDILGTKAIWYYKDDEIFVASSSQRAIIQLIGKFEFNEEVIPWMLSNGLLGPGQSWDKNLSLLPPESSLLIDRNTWSLTLKNQDVIFKPNKKTDSENLSLLKTTMNSVFSQMSLDYSQWNLTLSGGYDSRGILLGLPKIDKKGNTIKTVTWGLEDALKTSDSDAYIARKLADKLETPHQYYSTDTSKEESINIILDRFLRNGEGRIDHIGGYMDGFSIWKNLYEKGITGIIRGDEVFGSYNFASEFHMKKFMGLSVPNDYDNLKRLNYFKKNVAKLPTILKKKEEETSEMWRDRLYHSHLVPTFLSALEDLKQPYLEQVNPLLSKNIVSLIRQLPDHLRTEKKIFKKYVNSFNYSIKFAKSSAIEPMRDIFRQKGIVKVVKEELNSPFAKLIFPEELLSYIIANMTITSEKIINSKNLLKKIKNWIPKSIKKRMLKEIFTPNADINTVGFRIFMIIKMNKLLIEDSQVISRSITDFGCEPK